MKSIRIAFTLRSAKKLLIVSLGIACASVHAASPEAVASPAGAMDRLVADVCQRQIVLLGEDGNHAGGATSTAKVELVTRLIDECGFNAVFFESSIYDFLDFQRQLDRGKASPEMLADAIGGLWSLTSETDPLITSLYARAKSGSVALAGLDLQLGSATSVYTKSAFSTELAAYLPEDRRKPCIAEIDRLTRWRYETEQEATDAQKPLRECAIDIQKGVGRGNARGDATVAIMAENLLRAVELSTGDWYNNRDKAMYNNFVWYRSHQPDRNKIIVWCATVHAVKDLSFLVSERRTLGSQIHSLLKGKAATIGFSALGGSYGRNPTSLTTLAPAPADSLESQAFAGVKGDQVYLDGKQLKALGVIAAHPLQYTQWNSTEWSNVVDGMLVFREEHPVHSVRSARPQQLAAEVASP